MTAKNRLYIAIIVFLWVLVKSDSGLWSNIPHDGIWFNNLAETEDEPNQGTITELCLNHTKFYMEHLKKPWTALLPQGLWAYKMLDATGKLPDGIFTIFFEALGSYKSCLEVEVNTPKVNFVGSYVKVQVKAISNQNNIADTPRLEDVKTSPSSSLPLAFTFGFCMPSSCSGKDVAEMVKRKLNNGLAIPKYTALAEQKHTKDDHYEMDALDFAMFVFVFLLAVAIISGTILEFYFSRTISNPPQAMKGWQKFLVGYSAYSNTIKLISIKDTSKATGGNFIGCLDGMRYLSMTWVLICHVFGAFGQTIKVTNTIGLIRLLLNSFWFQAIVNGFPSVDSFFLISGCLVAFLTFKELDRTKGKINVFMFYIHRYLRLSGSYAFVIWLTTTVQKALVGGPSNKLLQGTIRCRDVWWYNLLYINNFNLIDTFGCVGQSWYLANDMQMFCVSLIIVYPMWRYKIPGLIFAGVITIVSCAIPLTMTVLRDWPATMLLSGGINPLPFSYFEFNYVKPWNRFSPYIVGILLGYVLHITKNKPIRLSKIAVAVGWMCAFLTGFAVVFGLNIPQRLTDAGIKGDPLLPAQDALYGGFHRFAWAVALSWVVFACARGYGGWINDFLCWEAFQPLGRLSYLVFLTHLTVLGVIEGYTMFSPSFSIMLIVVYCLAVLSYSTLVSAVLFVVIEMPWTNTQNFLFSYFTCPASSKRNNGIGSMDKNQG